jgi:chromate transport protein ChrA
MSLPGRLIEALLTLALVGLAILLIGPVAATMLTPGWIETADARDWASMTFFLCVAAAILLVALRLTFRRTRSVRGVLRSRDWWALAALAVLATVCAALASHWMIALPGLLPIGATVLMARRRARQERLVLVDSDSPDLPPRASFTARQSSGPRSI